MTKFEISISDKKFADHFLDAYLRRHTKEVIEIDEVIKKILDGIDSSVLEDKIKSYVEDFLKSDKVAKNVINSLKISVSVKVDMVNKKYSWETQEPFIHRRHLE